MTLKRLLVIPLVVSLSVFAYFSADVVHSFEELTRSVSVTPYLVLAVVAAVSLQLIGHWIRAKKTALLFGRVKESSVRFHFRALSIGYLFNAILPLRLGELVRARIISDAMTISFSYALVLVIFERLIDVLFLGMVGLVLAGAFVHERRAELILYSLALLATGLVMLAVILLLMRQNKAVLRLWHRATGLLNEDLKNGSRFKLWSVIYGLQQTIKPKVLKTYLSWTALSWLFYAGSLVVIVQYLLSTFSASEKSALTAAPYFGVAAPSGPANLGGFSGVVNEFTQFSGISGSASLVFNMTAWAVLVLPIAGIGVLLLFSKTRETLWQSREKQVSRQSLEHKLYRQEDISDEMKHFLDNYFSGNSLSKIVHELELSEHFRLVKYFKGGSDAITILALQDGHEVVKKIIPLEFKDRLKAQYDWLERFKGTPGIVKVLGEEDAGKYYSIDLAFSPDDEMLYEFIHQNPIVRSQEVMDEVAERLMGSVHGDLNELATYPKARKEYIDKHIFGCLEKAAKVDPVLMEVAKPKILLINGKEYDNLFQVMERIKKHPQAWKDIATYRRSGVVHGDVIVDNLLVSKKTGDVLIIDPAPDGNLMEGPVFDFGKMLQSFHCGYEALLRDESRVHLTQGNRIMYHDLASDKYHVLADYVKKELAPRYLSEGEQRAMLFHAGALYIRRLKHQVYYTPANVLKFYAVGVKTLNEFLAQYEPAAKPTEFAAITAALQKKTIRPKAKKASRKKPRKPVSA